MGRRISKEFLHPSILEGVNAKIGNLSELETNAKGNMVQAVNELLDKLDNSTEIEAGKELIANAVGEPLVATDTFAEMGNDINGLLNTFKTNMINAGVVVESGDKFKALIEKIKGLTEGEGNKGIRLESGQIEGSAVADFVLASVNPGSGSSYQKCIQIPSLDFNPIITVVYAPYESGNYSSYAILWYDDIIGNLVATTYSIGPTSSTETPSYHYKIYEKFEDGVHVPVWTGNPSNKTYTWYAIGVGEEDTALRDSLADILEDKGVEVTEEDDMASLITKVENIKSGGLDIISATELPATGRENQICVITDNPVNNFLTSNNFSDKDTVINENTIFIYENPISCLLPLQMGNNGMINYYYINTIYQGNNILNSYIYQNNNWNQLTEGALVVLSYDYYNNDVFGNMTLPSQDDYGNGIASPLELNNTGLVLKNYNYCTVSCVTTNQIDFNKYAKARISYKSTGVAGYNFNFIIAENSTSHSLRTVASSSNVNSAYNSYINASKSITISKADDVNKEYSVEIDISSFTHVSELRLVFFCSSASFSGVYKNSGSFVITKIELC